MTGWISPSPHWATYCALMSCHLVDLDKRPGVSPNGNREMLHQDLAKLVMRAAVEQGKMVCGNHKLCAGLDAGIEIGTHTVGKGKS